MQKTPRSHQGASRLACLSDLEGARDDAAAHLDLYGYTRGGGRISDSQSVLDETVFEKNDFPGEKTSLSEELPCLLTSGRGAPNAAAEEPKTLAQSVARCRRKHFRDIWEDLKTESAHCSVGGETPRQEGLTASDSEEESTRRVTDRKNKWDGTKVLDGNAGTELPASSDPQNGHLSPTCLSPVYVHRKHAAPRGSDNTGGKSDSLSVQVPPASRASSLEHEAATLTGEEVEEKARESPSRLTGDSRRAVGDPTRACPSLRAPREKTRQKNPDFDADNSTVRGTGDQKGLPPSDAEEVCKTAACRSCSRHTPVADPVGRFCPGGSLSKHLEPFASTISTDAIQSSTEAVPRRRGDGSAVSPEQSRCWSAAATQVPRIQGVSSSGERQAWMCSDSLQGTKSARKKKKTLLSAAKVGFREARRVALGGHRVTHYSGQTGGDAQVTATKEGLGVEDEQVVIYEDQDGDSERRNDIPVENKEHTREEQGEDCCGEKSEEDRCDSEGRRASTLASHPVAGAAKDAGGSLPGHAEKRSREDCIAEREAPPSSHFSPVSSPVPAPASPSCSSPSPPSPFSESSFSSLPDKTAAQGVLASSEPPSPPSPPVGSEEGIEWDATQRKWIFHFVRDGQPAKKTFSVDKYGFSTARRLALMAKQMSLKTKADRRSEELSSLCPSLSSTSPSSPVSSPVVSPLDSSVCLQGARPPSRGDSKSTLLSEPTPEGAEGGKAPPSAVPSPGESRASKDLEPGIQPASDDRDREAAEKEPSETGGSELQDAQAKKGVGDSQGTQLSGKRRRGRPPKKKKVVGPRQPRLTARVSPRSAALSRPQTPYILRRSLRVESRIAAKVQREEAFEGEGREEREERFERDARTETLEPKADADAFFGESNNPGCAVEIKPRRNVRRSESERDAKSPPGVFGAFSRSSKQPPLEAAKSELPDWARSPSSLSSSPTGTLSRDHSLRPVASSAPRGSLPKREEICNLSRAPEDSGRVNANGEMDSPPRTVPPSLLSPQPLASSLVHREVSAESSSAVSSFSSVSSGRSGVELPEWGTARKSSLVIRGGCLEAAEVPCSAEVDIFGEGLHATTEERIRHLRQCLDELRQQQALHLQRISALQKTTKEAEIFDCCQTQDTLPLDSLPLKRPFASGCRPDVEAARDACETAAEVGKCMRGGLRIKSELRVAGDSRRSGRDVQEERQREQGEQERDAKETEFREGASVSVCTLQVIAAVLSDFLRLCGSPSSMKRLGLGDRQIQFCQQSIPLLRDSLLFLRSVQSTSDPAVVAFASLFREILLLLPRSTSASPLEICRHLTKLVRSLSIWRRAVTGERRGDRGDNQFHMLEEGVHARDERMHARENPMRAREERMHAEEDQLHAEGNPLHAHAEVAGEGIRRLKERQKRENQLPSASASEVLRALQLWHSRGEEFLPPHQKLARWNDALRGDSFKCAESSPSPPASLPQRDRESVLVHGRAESGVTRVAAVLSRLKEEASMTGADDTKEARLLQAVRQFVASKQVPPQTREEQRELKRMRRDREAESERGTDSEEERTHASDVDASYGSEESRGRRAVREDRGERAEIPTGGLNSEDVASWREKIHTLHSAAAVGGLRGNEALQRLFSLWGKSHGDASPWRQSFAPASTRRCVSPQL
ncbi:AP2 domain transcription factor AP2VI-2 [Toxoplasma gondii MAS]|uniref:AP2 domain transcription factor AP2VI-2 n=1 Tax=Toxoplasma gondii MAS TaxID=943118 RepID=A0A086QQK6_TOXGO|nr:AP2 domain transcription factor AP2VI-2 [Toxoplasma gondii MAS]